MLSLRPAGDANLSITALCVGDRVRGASCVAGIPSDSIAGNAARRTRFGAAAGDSRAKSRTQRRDDAPPRFVVSPFVCIVTAVAVGIALDRFLDPWGTRKWVGLALVFIAIACFLARRRSRRDRFCSGISRPVWRRPGITIATRTWQPDDLALRVTEDGRPAWVRGVVREALGVRNERGIRFRER